MHFKVLFLLLLSFGKKGFIFFFSKEFDNLMVPVIILNFLTIWHSCCVELAQLEKSTNAMTDWLDFANQTTSLLGAKRLNLG